MGWSNLLLQAGSRLPQLLDFGLGIWFGCAVCAPGFPVWIWRELERDGVRSERGEYARWELLALCSSGVSSSPFASLLEFLWSPGTGGSLLHHVHSQREGNGSRWKPSLSESQLCLELWPRQDSIHTWPGKILMFFRAGSGTLPAASEQPQPGQEELPGSLEPVQNQLLLSRAQVT